MYFGINSYMQNYVNEFKFIHDMGTDSFPVATCPKLLPASTMIVNTVSVREADAFMLQG